MYTVIHFYLQLANSPSFWCGLRLTHQNYARHPRQLVRSCLQLGTLKDIVRQNGSADCLGSRKSAQLCLAPSRPPPVFFWKEFSISFSLKVSSFKFPLSSIKKRSQLNILKLTFSSINSSKSSISVLLLAGNMSSKTWAGRKTKMKTKLEGFGQNAINDICHSPMQWLTVRQDLRKKMISLITASAK